MVDLTAGQSYGWAGNDSALTANSIYIWNPATAPVNIAFVQPQTSAAACSRRAARTTHS